MAAPLGIGLDCGVLDRALLSRFYALQPICETCMEYLGREVPHADVDPDNRSERLGR